MPIKRSLVTALMLACAVPLASAVEHRTGYLPPTAAEKAWADANMIKVTSVLPNRLALQRVAAEQQNRTGFAAPITAVAADDGAEIMGVKGAAAAAPATNKLTASASMAYPRVVDNSAEAWFPPISSQGGLGSCASFSTTYYTMTSQVARLRGWNVKADNNPAHIFTPRFTYNMINNGVDSGSYHLTAYWLLTMTGCATYADFPYDAVDYKSWPTTASVWREALNYRMLNCGTVTAIDTEVGLANAKQMLADGYIFNFPAAVSDWQFTSLVNDPATTADDALFAVGVPATRPRVVSHCIDGVVNHAMTIVGYNDDVWCDINRNGVVDAGEKGALRIANSWGQWEDGGFVWVAYDALKTVSGVAGGYSGPREEAIADHSIAWMSARPSYTPSLVAEFTVTHAQRNQMSLTVGRGPTTATSPTTTSGFNKFSNCGGSWAFDGTSTAIQASFIIDCTDLVNTASGNRWFASFNDNAANIPGSFTRVRFIDSGNAITTASTTNPSGGLPQSVDNATVRAYADNALSTNVAPVAQGRNLTTALNTSISSIALVATDINGDSLAYTVVASPSYGMLTGSGASRTYEPNANYQGTDFFTFKANDGKVDSNVATVAIRVGGINTAPVAQSQSKSVVSEGSVEQMVITLVATDANLDVLTYAVGLPAHGTLFGVAPNLTYLPDQGYVGSDIINFKANDGMADSNTATVTITVINAPPTVATAAAATSNPVTTTTTALSVLGANDCGESNLTYTWATTGTPPAAVTFSANNTNAAKASTATFTKVGSYVLQCTMKDAGNLTATSSVTVTVNQTPTNMGLTPASASVNATQTRQFTASINDQFGAALTSQPTFAWSLSDSTSGSLSTTGLFTANSTGGGPYILTATGGGKSKTATVSVVAATLPVGPAGYTWCASEGGSFVLPGASDVAYGGDVKFNYRYDQTGTFVFINGNFVDDPLPGAAKNGFYKLLIPMNKPPTVATIAAATPNVVTGTTAAVSVLGADDAGEPSLTYAWTTTGTPPAEVTFSANQLNAGKASTATFTKPGSYALLCTIKDAGNLTVTSGVTVTVPDATPAGGGGSASASASSGGGGGGGGCGLGSGLAGLIGLTMAMMASLRLRNRQR